jgi:hypothetical protein
MSDEAWFPEPFGPIYDRPEGAPCPGCECCTARLCEKAASTGLRCAWHAEAAGKEIVANCPCPAPGRPR